MVDEGSVVSNGATLRPSSKDPAGAAATAAAAGATAGGTTWSSGFGSTQRMTLQGSKAFSEAARRKSMKVPRDGIMMRITTVSDIYKQVRMLVGMVANVWGWYNATTTSFRQVLPGLVKIDPRDGRKQHFIMNGFYLQELESACTSTKSVSSNLRTNAVTNPHCQEVALMAPTRYFEHIKVLIKLRWLLRLHSACCELDYKMCSLRNLIMGIQYVVLQQCEEVAADSIFDTKVSQHVGAHLHLESVLDDITDQLHRALGTAWRPFLEYVATCDPMRSVHHSKMDILQESQIVDNDALLLAVDTAFLANFLRGPRSDPLGKLSELFTELDQLGIPLPEVPPLRGAQHLRAWAKAHTKPTRADRERASRTDHEKLAQMDAVLLVSAIELHQLEVMASPDELAEDIATVVASSFPNSGSGVPGATDFGSTGRAPGSGGPPAARVIPTDKPQLSPALVDAAIQCIHHHQTFPDGIRERLYNLLVDEYGLTEGQTQRLAIAATQNVDGKRLSEHTQLQIEGKEKRRLREYSVTFNKDTNYLLQPSLVAGPCQQGLPAKYHQSPQRAERLPFGSAFTSSDMTRSLPDFRGFTVKNNDREPFKVPMITGPLTMDPDLGKLRTTGLFIRMPPLKGGN